MTLSARLRHFLIVVSTATVTLTVIWWGVWTYAAAQYRAVINGWVEAGRANGYQISYDSESLFGFPHHVVVRFINVQWVDTDDIHFHADDIDIATIPWRWRDFDTKFKHHVSITAPIDATGNALILAGEDGRAHVELDRDGVWKFSRISIVNAQFGQTPNYVATAGKLTASATRPEQPPKNHDEVGLTLTGTAENVTLPEAMPSPFGLDMKRLAVDMRVMDPVPDFRKKDAVAAWNKDMGVVQFDNLQMDWGPLALKAKGTMGFDDDLQPEGAFSSVIGNHDGVLKALTEHHYIAAEQGEMLNSALSLFAKPAKVDDASGIEVPITVQLGGLFLGPVKIFSFPEIEWPEANPPAPAASSADKPAAPAPTPAP